MREMKSIKKYIIITCLVICMTGCGQAKEKDNTAENVKESVSQNVYEKDTQDSVSQNDHEQDQQASVSQNTDDGKLHVRVHNPYFFDEKELTNLSARLEYCEGDVTINRAGKLTMKLIKNYEKGDLFKLSVAHERNIQDYFGEERLNIYFYVTNDKIYRVPSYINRDGEEISIYEDDLVIAYLDTDDKLISESALVCCEENFKNKVELEHAVIKTEINSGICERTEWWKDGRYYHEESGWNEPQKLLWFDSTYGTGADSLYIGIIGDADVEQADQRKYFKKENQTEINITEEIKNGNFGYLNDDVRSRGIIRNVYEALKSSGDLNWVQRDLNNDGIDDLILCEDFEPWKGSKVVVGIFACEKDHAECIHWDAVDYSEFYIVGPNGELANSLHYGFLWERRTFIPISYEKDWTRVKKYTLYAYDSTYIDEEGLEAWKDKYGPEMEEPGKYYVKRHADGTRDFLTKEEFDEILMEDLGITYDEDD